MSPVLQLTDVTAGYGSVPVLHDLDLQVEERELVCVIGANGAGKSTLLRAVSGVADVHHGSIVFDGKPLDGKAPQAVARAGVAHVPENRRVFATHTVEENLRLGAWVRGRGRRRIDDDLVAVYEQFPVLRDRCKQAGGTLSGGEQQMLAIGIALMARPRLLMLDEPSLGLAPLVVEQVFEEIGRLRERDTTILLVEQLANKAFEVADRGVVLQLGRVVAEGTAAQLREDETVQRAYLG